MPIFGRNSCCGSAHRLYFFFSIFGWNWMKRNPKIFVLFVERFFTQKNRKLFQVLLTFVPILRMSLRCFKKDESLKLEQEGLVSLHEMCVQRKFLIFTKYHPKSSHMSNWNFHTSSWYFDKSNWNFFTNLGHTFDRLKNFNFFHQTEPTLKTGSSVPEMNYSRTLIFLLLRSKN